MKLPLRRKSHGHPRLARYTMAGAAPLSARSTSQEPADVARGFERPSRWRSRRSSVEGRPDEPLAPAPPIKSATWKWYIPVYFWSGGLSAGAWLAATAEDIAGDGDRELIRAARYLSAGGLALGTVLLIIDLGRPDRFLNMLRIIRPRSTMSLGSWGLSAFGACCGAAVLLQALDDGILGRRRIFARLSRGHAGWLLHAAGLPLALFVGGYTGVLLGTTSTPSWARRARLLGPLFTASALSTGMSAVSLVLHLGGGGRPGAHRRLARAESAALATELGLALVSRRRALGLPSARGAMPATRAAHAVTIGVGMATPLLAQLWSARARLRGPSRVAAGGALLAVAGGLALRVLTTWEGVRSALTPDDTFVFTGGRARGEVAPRSGRPTPRGKRPSSLRRGELRGIITIVQDDRIRVVDRAGRGYLLTLGRRRESQSDVERWRDGEIPVQVSYRGVPDVDARVQRITPL